MPVRGDHAIVLGGSVAGLPTARVLSRYFDTVTIVERDPLPDRAEHRPGVPQSPHLHGLLYGGRLLFDEIYGDEAFTEAMRAVGGPYFDFGRHQAFRFPEGWIKRTSCDLMVVFATRWTMEHVVRRLTQQVPNIHFVQGHVTGLLADTTGARVTGVKARGEEGEWTLEADLVVDACGRGSRSPKWLEKLGFTPPEESVVRSFLGYATVYGYVPDDAWPGDIKSIAAPPFPGATRGGFVVPQENGLVGIMAAGQSRDYPPGDEEGFTEFLRTAITPVMYDMWRQCEPVTEIETTKTSQNRLRRWHELDRRPQGFIPIGDAVAAFNPVYGQGMTSAVLQAKTLGDRLAENDDLDAVMTGFPEDAVQASQFAWSAATDADLGFPVTEVENLAVSDKDPETISYLSDMRRAATFDGGVASAFFRAQATLNGGLLFQPQVMERVRTVLAEAGPDERDHERPPEWSEDAEPIALS